MQIPPLPAEFVAATGDQVANLAYEYLAGIFTDLHGDHEDKALRALPAPLADFWILGWLDYEVTQGGLATYFMNSHGRQVLLAVDALRRCGAEDVAQCLEEAHSIVSRHEATWAKRTQDLDAAGEFAIVYPFRDLDGVDELSPVAERFDHLWFDRKPHWGELMSDRLELFRRKMSEGKSL